MNIKAVSLFSAILVSFLFIIGCSDDDSGINYKPLSISQFYDSSDGKVKVLYPETSGDVELTYTLDINVNDKQVYFIFTNSNTGRDVTMPYFISKNVWHAETAFDPMTAETNLNNEIREYPNAQRGIPEVKELTKELLQNMEDYEDYRFPKAGFLSNTYLKSESYTLDGSKLFYDHRGNEIHSTLRIKSDHTINGRTLYIWVADDCWHDGGTKEALVTSSMINILSEKFFGTSEDYFDSIFHLITNIFGDEWSDMNNQRNMIPMVHQIHILVYDIDGENFNPDFGGTLGYYFPRDNFTNESNSNQKVMFYINGPLYASGDDNSWSEDDFWPQEIIATLAHELQHVIHFHEKTAKRFSLTGKFNQSDTWMDEMCSLMAEDFVAGYLNIPGPRGFGQNENSYDYSAGTGTFSRGRLPRFNFYNDTSLTQWLHSQEDYSVSYSFGAYLARNFGGPEFFDNLVKNNPYTDLRAVLFAAEEYRDGESISFKRLMQDWGAAVVLSDIIDEFPVTGKYQYNNNAAFTYNTNDTEYNLGSINLYNYKFHNYKGPWFYSGDMLSANDIARRSSNIYYNAGVLTKGKHTWTMQMQDGVNLTVVVRD